jgi:hypothetical protein
MKSSMSLVAFLVIAAGGCAREPVASPPPPEPFKAVANSKQLMQAIVIPASDGVWGVASEPPKDDAGWLAAENHAIALAESGNLLMIGNRVVDREHWLKYSSSLVDTANTALEGIRARDMDKISAAGDAIYEVCEACHMQYMPKPPE